MVTYIKDLYFKNIDFNIPKSILKYCAIAMFIFTTFVKSIQTVLNQLFNFFADIFN